MTEKEYTLNDVYLSLTDDNLSKILTEPEKLMEKSLICEGFEKLKKLPYTTNYVNKKRKKKVNVKVDLPDEVKTDLEVLKMRSVINPKRFYKRNVTKEINKANVQVGTVMDSPADFYHSRLPNKSRKTTLVDELLADANFKKDMKRRYVDIIQQGKYKKFPRGPRKHKKKRINK